jgi:plastocyanin
MSVFVITISGILVLPQIVYVHQNLVYAQTTASVSIVHNYADSAIGISKAYDPSPLTVKTGTSVTWTNNDSSIHTVTSGLP